MDARRSEFAWGLFVPLVVVALLAVVAPRTGQPEAWLAFAGAMPMFAAMFTRAPFTGIVALATVLACGFSAAAAYGAQFTEALPVLVGVIVLSGAAVLVAQAKSPVAPRPAPATAPTPAPGLSGEDPVVDELTGLPTRRGIRARLGEEQPSGHRVVALIDCDHLAALNEKHGRAVGDTFVFAVAGRTRYALTEPDVVARWTDQQFLIVLHSDLEQSLPTLTLIADKVNQNPIRTDSGLIPATMSVGATAWAADEALETAVERARRALYRGKVEGGGRLVVEA
ncbi:MAG: diguanylate cyclase [Actinomycetales bacterium]|nr:diguanylate cyclase [Actinomycetales bacterium]